jgi:hypothetical protein
VYTTVSLPVHSQSLQTFIHRFDSGPRLQQNTPHPTATAWVRRSTATQAQRFRVQSARKSRRHSRGTGSIGRSGRGNGEYRRRDAPKPQFAGLTPGFEVAGWGRARADAHLLLYRQSRRLQARPVPGTPDRSKDPGAGKSGSWDSGLDRGSRACIRARVHATMIWFR